MNVKRFLCLAIAMMMAMGGFVLAEGGDLQAQLDAANARVAELEAQVEKYRAVYEGQVVAEFGETGVVLKEAVQEQYDQLASMYAQFNYKMDAQTAAALKHDIAADLVRQGVIRAKEEELGLSVPDEAALADLQEKAAADFEGYVSYYIGQFTKEGDTEETAREATVAALKDAGIDVDAILQHRIENYADEKLHDYVTAGVTVDDADIQAEYEAMIAEDQENYSDDEHAYSSARNGGETIAWNPEGYRAVKHVLVKFSDEQASRYSELQDAMSSLKSELAALDEAEQAAEDEAETDEAAEEAEAAEADETAEADEAAEETTPRSREEIQTDIGAIGASVEALYSELMPTVQEVVDAFNGGASIDSLIDEYGGDPGMRNEPTASQGYAVAANTTSLDPAFVEAAMSIPEVGQISEPARGSYGIYIVYYMSDITPGAVPFEDIRDAVEAKALEDKISKTYEDQINAWVEEANAVYYTDRFRAPSAFTVKR